MLSNTGVNKVILLGIADGPFERKLINGQRFLFFNLTTAEQIKKGNDYVEHHENHRIRVPEKLVTPEIATLARGITLFIEGRIQTTSVVDETRVKRYNLDIVTSKIDVLGMLDISLIK